MPVDARRAAKALKVILQGASADADTPLSSLESDAETANQVSEVLVKMGYATVSNGAIRLTSDGENVKNG